MAKYYEKFNVWREKSIDFMKKNQVVKVEPQLSGSVDALLMV